MAKEHIKLPSEQFYENLQGNILEHGDETYEIIKEDILQVSGEEDVLQRLIYRFSDGKIFETRYRLGDQTGLIHMIEYYKPRVLEPKEPTELQKVIISTLEAEIVKEESGDKWTLLVAQDGKSFSLPALLIEVKLSTSYGKEFEERLLKYAITTLIKKDGKVQNKS